VDIYAVAGRFYIMAIVPFYAVIATCFHNGTYGAVGLFDRQADALCKEDYVGK